MCSSDVQYADFITDIVIIRTYLPTFNVNVTMVSSVLILLNQQYLLQSIYQAYGFTICAEGFT